MPSSRTLLSLKLSSVFKVPLLLSLATRQVGNKGQPPLSCSGRKRGLAGNIGSLVPSKHNPLSALILGTPVRDEGRLRAGASPGKGLEVRFLPVSALQGPTPASSGRGQPGYGCGLLQGRRAIYNISYLQLAHLPQVFGAAFLPSYLPD